MLMNGVHLRVFLESNTVYLVVSRVGGLNHRPRRRGDAWRNSAMSLDNSLLVVVDTSNPSFSSYRADPTCALSTVDR